MSISFSGLASGLDTDSWIEALVTARQDSLLSPLKTQYNTLNAQKTALSKVKSTYSSLLTTTQTFTDSKFGVASDIFASNKVSISDSSKVGVTVTNSTPRQNISLEILQLATNTKVTSSGSIAAPIDENTLVSSIASGSVKEGSLSFYVGDKRYSIEISKDDTLGAIADKMQDIALDEEGNSLISVSFDEGKFTITSNNSDVIRIGANSDTSSLMSALALKNKDDGSVQSSYSIGSLDLSKPLVSVESGFYKYNDDGEKVPLIQEGTFTIGNAEITVTNETTMNELISKINTNSESNATAFYDSVQNKLVITSKQEGAFNVNIEGGTSNVTDILGLTRNGNIIPESQELGQNSQIKLNGSIVESYSNVITSEVSGVAGLSLDLKDATEAGKNINITIGQDTDSVVSKVEELVKALNNLISTTDTATASGADLQYDSSLNSLRSDLRTTAANAISGNSVYKTLASIGITTGEVGTSVDADTNKFQIDKDKLVEALTNDPASVKTLLVGDSDRGISGIVQQIQDITEKALDVENGFFQTRETTLSSQMSNITARIETKSISISRYQSQLEAKFQAMEKQIAALQSQQSQMSSILSS